MFENNEMKIDILQFSTIFKLKNIHTNAFADVCSSVDVSAFPPHEPPPEDETKDAKLEEEPSLDDEL